METAKLKRAYMDLLAAADAVGQRAEQLSPALRAEIDWRLCHVALSDEILVAAVESTRLGQPAVVDNKPAMDAVAIAGLIARTDHNQRIFIVSEWANSFIAAVAQLTEEQANATIQLLLHDRNGRPVSIAERSWLDVVQLRAERHIPAHTKALYSEV